MPLFDYKNEGESFAFLDTMLSRFGTLTKILIDQGMKLCGKLQKLCEKTLINHHTISQDHLLK